MLCTLNEKCDRLRRAYGKACSAPRCQRHTCLQQLRTFFEKARESHAQGLLLCPCAPTDLGCGRRRRNTIAPSCALPSETPNCLDMRNDCLSDPLCRCGVRVRVGGLHTIPSRPPSQTGLGLMGQGPRTDCTMQLLFIFSETLFSKKFSYIVFSFV